MLNYFTVVFTLSWVQIKAGMEHNEEDSLLLPSPYAMKGGEGREAAIPCMVCGCMVLQSLANQ